MKMDMRMRMMRMIRMKIDMMMRMMRIVVRISPGRGWYGQEVSKFVDLVVDTVSSHFRRTLRRLCPTVITEKENTLKRMKLPTVDRTKVRFEKVGVSFANF